MDKELDLIYDKFDDLMKQGKLVELNNILNNIIVENCPIDILLGMLTASLPVKSKLPARNKLINEIKNCKEYEENLLKGLE